MPVIWSVEEAVEKAREVLNKMGHTIYFISEVIPGKEVCEDVWLVTATTLAGKLEIVLRKRDGAIITVRSKA